MAKYVCFCMPKTPNPGAFLPVLDMSCLLFDVGSGLYDRWLAAAVQWQSFHCHKLIWHTWVLFACKMVGFDITYIPLLYVFVCVLKHIRVCVCACVCVRACVCACMFVCACMYMCTRNSCVCIYVCVRACVCVHVCILNLHR